MLENTPSYNPWEDNSSLLSEEGVKKISQGSGLPDLSEIANKRYGECRNAIVSTCSTLAKLCPDGDSITLLDVPSIDSDVSDVRRLVIRRFAEKVSIEMEILPSCTLIHGEAEALLSDEKFIESRLQLYNRLMKSKSSRPAKSQSDFKKMVRAMMLSSLAEREGTSPEIVERFLQTEEADTAFSTETQKFSSVVSKLGSCFGSSEQLLIGLINQRAIECGNEFRYTQNSSVANAALEVTINGTEVKDLRAWLTGSEFAIRFDVIGGVVSEISDDQEFNLLETQGPSRDVSDIDVVLLTKLSETLTTLADKA